MAKGFIKKVLVAINGRQSSIQAAMYAIMMAKTYNISLKFVYVVDTATIKFLSMNKLLVTEEKGDFEEKLREGGKHYLNYVSMLASTKGLTCQTELREGGVFSEILKASQDFQADMIILGGNSDGKSKHSYKEQVMSKDENAVLSHANCPVLVVQKPDIEKLFKIF
ncbi:MAG: universal stress protein [Treponema sp.]|nr:universal stress protein [Treponema sp.]